MRLFNDDKRKKNAQTVFMILHDKFIQKLKIWDYLVKEKRHIVFSVSNALVVTKATYLTLKY